MVIPRIVGLHAEEAAFLWTQRSAAVGAPHYRVRQLADLDGRVEAHLDGLRVAGDGGWKICKEVLPLENAGECFALASVALDTGKDDRIAEALVAAAKAPGAASSALAWLEAAKSEKESRKLLSSTVPLHRRIALAAFAVRRVDPGKPLLDAAADPDPALRARALRALGELGKAEHLGLCQKHLDADDPAVRFAAAWSAALLAGDPNALVRLKEIASKEGPRQAEALDLALRRQDAASGTAWRGKLAGRLAVLAARAVGDPAGVPWLLELMKDPKLARTAGEAYEFITGDDLEDLKLSKGPPEGFESGPTDNPEDADVAMDPDDDLPWPDPAAVAKRWEGRKGAFAGGKRYLLGKEISPAVCEEALKTGKQRQRAAAALELSIRTPRRPLFEVRAPGFRQ